MKYFRDKQIFSKNLNLLINSKNFNLNIETNFDHLVWISLQIINSFIIYLSIVLLLYNWFQCYNNC